jgi:type IV secretion system protein VirB10
MDQEAMNSSIFFAGGAPPQLPTGNTTQTQTSQKDKSNGSPDKSSSDNAYDSQNMQKQKLDFLNSKPDTSIYDTHAMQFPASPYIIQAGTVIPAVLQTQINSNLPGNLVALVRSDVYDSINGQYLLIPKGSRLIGQYSSQLSYGQDQIQVKFERLIRPDGSSIVLPNPQGTNNQGVSGLSDEVNNHWGQVIGSSILAAVFNIPAIVATNQQNTNQTCTRDDTTGQVFCQPSVSTVLTTSALQSAGQTVSQVGGQLTQRSLNLQPTVIIHAGYTFSVMVMKDMIIPPFHSATS